MGTGNEMMTAIDNQAMAGGAANGGNFVDQPTAETKRVLHEIATYLDTAILTYQQPAIPATTTTTTKKDPSSLTVIVNGVKRKSPEERKEELRVFQWHCSLAIAYQSAA